MPLRRRRPVLVSRHRLLEQSRLAGPLARSQIDFRALHACDRPSVDGDVLIQHQQRVASPRGSGRRVFGCGERRIDTRALAPQVDHGEVRRSSKPLTRTVRVDGHEPYGTVTDPLKRLRLRHVIYCLHAERLIGPQERQEPDGSALATRNRHVDAIDKCAVEREDVQPVRDFVRLHDRVAMRGELREPKGIGQEWIAVCIAWQSPVRLQLAPFPDNASRLTLA